MCTPPLTEAHRASTTHTESCRRTPKGFRRRGRELKCLGLNAAAREGAPVPACTAGITAEHTVMYGEVLAIVVPQAINPSTYFSQCHCDCQCWAVLNFMFVCIVPAVSFLCHFFSSYSTSTLEPFTSFETRITVSKRT